MPARQGGVAQRDLKLSLHRLQSAVTAMSRQTHSASSVSTRLPLCSHVNKVRSSFFPSLPPVLQDGRSHRARHIFDVQEVHACHYLLISSAYPKFHFLIPICTQD